MSETKQDVEFTRDYTVQDDRVGTKDEESYKQGQRVSLSMSSAAHFINRGAAVMREKSGSK